MIRNALPSFVLLAAVAAPAVGMDEAPDAQETLRRAISAAGGRRALERMKGPMMWMERGSFHGMGSKIPFVRQYATKWPDWRRQEVEGVFTITVNGGRAWVTSANSTRKLKGGQLDEQLKQVRAAWAELLFPLTDKAYTLSRIDGVEVHGRPTVGLKASHANSRDLRFYFDKKSYLLVKLETEVISPQHGPKPVLSEAFFSAHKSFGAAKVPSKRKLYYDTKLFVESETVDYKMGATLDPRQFKEPN